MIAAIIIAIPGLIAVQVFLVVTVADWLSASDGHVRSDSRDFADRSAGRFIGAA